MKDIPLLKINSLVNDLRATTLENSSFSIFKANEAPQQLRQGNLFRNDFYAFVFILDGTIDFTIDFKTYKLPSNSAIFITPGQVISSTDNIKDGFGIIFKKEFLLRQGSQKWLQSLPMYHRFHSEPWIDLDKEFSEQLSFFLNKMMEEVAQSRDYKYEAVKAYLILTLIQLTRLYHETKSSGHNESDHVVLQYESFIDEHYKDIRTVKEYAEMLFMTPQNLNRICKKATGKSASDLINEKLLIEIKRNLIYTNDSIEEIAHEHNFYDNSYFTKYFKKAEGLTPTEFRKQSSKNRVY